MVLQWERGLEYHALRGNSDRKHIGAGPNGAAQSGSGGVNPMRAQSSRSSVLRVFASWANRVTLLFLVTGRHVVAVPLIDSLKR